MGSLHLAGGCSGGGETEEGDDLGGAVQCREMWGGGGEEEQCEGLGLGRLFGVSVAGLQMWLSYWRGCRLGEEGPPVGALEHLYMLKSGRAGVSSEGDVVGKVGGRRLGVPCRPGGRCQSQILELLRRHQVPCGLLPPAGGLPGGRPVVLSPLRLTRGPQGFRLCSAAAGAGTSRPGLGPPPPSGRVSRRVGRRV